jgi:NTE family protein
MTHEPPQTHAVVLSGGGANGAYEVGVLKALLSGTSSTTNYEPADLKVAAGTSFGAYNAAALFSHWKDPVRPPIDYLEHVWVDIIPQDDSSGHNHIYRYRGDPLNVFSPTYNLLRPGKPYVDLAGDAFFFARDWLRRGLHFFEAQGTLASRTARLLDVSSFVSTEPTLRLICETLRFEQLRRTERPLRITATNWRTGKAKTFENHELTDDAGPRVITASTAIPGVFPQVNVDSEYYADGAVVMNTPLAPAIHAGADILHVVYLNPDLEDIPLLQVPNLIDTISRMFFIQSAASMNRDIQVADQINRGLAISERGGTLPLDTVPPMGPSRWGRFRKLMVHRYSPRDPLDGILGFLNFDRNRMCRLIQEGFDDTTHHDCALRNCLLPQSA